MIREIYVPFAPLHSTTMSAASSGGEPQQENDEPQGVARDETPRQRVQPELTPPWRTPIEQVMSDGPQEAGEPPNPRSRQESGIQRDFAARGAGKSKPQAAAGTGPSSDGGLVIGMEEKDRPRQLRVQKLEE